MARPRAGDSETKPELVSSSVVSDSSAPEDLDGPTEVTPRDPMLGRRLGGRYEVEEALGAGGASTVYLGRHMQLGSPVAIKILHPRLVHDTKRETMHRFMAEARISANLNHPNIVRSFDVGTTEEGVPYFVLELLKGTPLVGVLNKGRFAPTRALHIAIETLKALEAAHGHKIIHRDVKPENIFVLDPHASEPRIKLLDFGIAKITSKTFSTIEGSVFGTPYYMSPEQFRDTSKVDARTDLYAVGVVLYEMLSGKCPFAAQNATKVFMEIVQRNFRPLREYCPELPETLARDVERAFEFEPEARFQTAKEFRERLEAYKDFFVKRRDSVSPTGRTMSSDEFAAGKKGS